MYSSENNPQKSITCQFDKVNSQSVIIHSMAKSNQPKATRLALRSSHLNGTHVSNDLPDGRRVGGVEDLSHQQGLDRTPHDPGDGVGLQLLHEVITEWSWGARWNMSFWWRFITCTHNILTVIAFGCCYTLQLLHLTANLCYLQPCMTDALLFQ